MTTPDVPLHVDLLPSALVTMKDLGLRIHTNEPRDLWTLMWRIHDARVSLMNAKLILLADREDIPETAFQNFLSFVGACVEGRTAVGKLDPLDEQERCYVADIAENFGLEWLEHPDGSYFEIADLFAYYEAWLSARAEGRCLGIHEWEGAKLPPGYGE